jgi:hypothetical protein
LRLTTSNFIFQLNTCDCSPDVTSSLTRGWICRSQLLLVLASKVILRSESRGTHNHILLSQISDSSNLEGWVPVFTSPRNRVALLHPGHWVPFLSPPATSMDTVEVFDLASVSMLGNSLVKIPLPLLRNGSVKHHGGNKYARNNRRTVGHIVYTLSMSYQGKQASSFSQNFLFRYLVFKFTWVKGNL